MEHYDLIVIGGGPAGYAAAMRAFDLGKRTLLVERDRQLRRKGSLPRELGRDQQDRE